MPEGPEVKIIVDGLNQILSKKFIVNVEITPNSRYRKKAPKGFNDFVAFVDQKKPKIKKVNCKGKFIYFEIDGGWYIFNQLGMSGYWNNRNQKY